MEHPKILPSPGSFRRESKKHNHEINVIMKEALSNASTKEQLEICERKVNIILKTVLNELLPGLTGGRIPRDAWVLNTHLRFEPFHIVLLASCQGPTRFLAAITRPRQDETAIGVLDSFQYHFHKLDMKIQKRSGKKSLVITDLKPGKLCTTRRGWYAIHKDIYNEKLSARDVNGTPMIREDQRARLVSIFNQYVDGMTRRPKKTFPLVQEDMGMEQFILDKYPTPEWRYHVNNLEDEDGESADGDDGQAAPGTKSSAKAHKRARETPVAKKANPVSQTACHEGAAEPDGDESDSADSRLTFTSGPRTKKRRHQKPAVAQREGMDKANKTYVDENGNCIGYYDLSRWSDDNADVCEHLETETGQTYIAI